MKLTTLALASISLAAFGQVPAPTPTQSAPAHRLLCLYMDLTSLSPADLASAQASAIQFVEKQATPADLVAVMTYTSQLNVLQDFTDDHDKLTAVLRMIMPGQLTAPDDASARLQAIQAAAAVLGSFPEKKAILYFSTGVPLRTADNQAAMSAVVNSLMRANISLYPVDARGLVAAPPR
jgi:VWFA-related protein